MELFVWLWANEKRVLSSLHFMNLTNVTIWLLPAVASGSHWFALASATGRQLRSRDRMTCRMNKLREPLIT